MNKPRIVITHRDTRLVLSAYRPSCADARDPFFGEALEQAKRDAKLMEWFLKQLEFDDVIVAKLRTLRPSAELHSEIFTGLREIRVPRRLGAPWWALAVAE